MKNIVLITGHIGTGKSTISDMLRRRGYVVIDTDQLRKDVFRVNPAVRAVLFGKYNQSVIGPDGSLSTGIRDEAMESMDTYIWLDRISRNALSCALKEAITYALEPQSPDPTYSLEGTVFIEAPHRFNWIIKTILDIVPSECIHQFRITVSDPNEQVSRVVERYRKRLGIRVERTGDANDSSTTDEISRNAELLDDYGMMIRRTLALQENLDRNCQEVIDSSHSNVIMPVVLRNDDPELLDSLVNQICDTLNGK